MKNILLCLFFIAILSCNSNPTKVATKEKSMATKEQKRASDFLISEITTDTLQLAIREAKNYSADDQKYLNSTIFYTISGKIKNTSDKTFVKARFEGQMKIKFDNKEIIERIDLLSSSINGDEIIDWDAYNISKTWKPDEAYSFNFITYGIDKIYSNYNPLQVEYILSLKAEDPVGYIFNDIIFQKDLKSQWVFKK